jgi:D-xylose transport system substrate-binding protein
MRRSAVGLVTVGVAAALSVSACGGGSSNNNKSNSSGSSSSSSSGGGSGAITAACKLSSPPTSNAKLPSSSASGQKASGKVGVILPDTTSSTRYTLYDAPLLKSSLSAAGLQPDVQNAGGSTARYQQIAQSMIGEGVKVLIMDSIDATSGAAVERQATAAGIKVIDYDRVNLGGTAQYYVSFDNQDVGRLQGQTLVDCLNQDGAKNAQVIEMAGGKDVDNNAILFANGANSVLRPLANTGKLKIASESVVKGWDVNQAAPLFTQALTANGGKVNAVLAANDDIANAVIGVLKGNGLAGHVVVTGQDAGIEGLQNIINGQQSMTIFKNVKTEANAAAALAIALIANKDPGAAGLTLSNFDDPKSPNHKIKALLLPPQVITQANVNDVIKAGALTQSEICKGIESACSQLGIS